MTVEECRQGDVVVLRPRGRLDSRGAPVLAMRLLTHATGKRPAILVDLSEVEYLSSAGLRVLLLAKDRVGQATGRLCLCAAQEQVRDVLEISGLARAFRLHRGQGEALAEFAIAA